MKLKMNDRTIRLLKVLWLPAVLVVMVLVEPYAGITNTPYVWAYIGLQVLLFVAYTYILYRSRPKPVPADRKLKGRRKPKK